MPVFFDLTTCQIFSLVFWSKRWHKKDILKLTDLYYYYRLYDRTQRCQISLIMTKWPCCPCVGTCPRQLHEAGPIFLVAWILKAWAGHHMISQIFTKFWKIKCLKILTAIFYAFNSSKKRPQKCENSEMGAAHATKSLRILDPNNNKLFFRAVIKLLMNHRYNSLRS